MRSSHFYEGMLVVPRSMFYLRTVNFFVELIVVPQQCFFDNFFPPVQYTVGWLDSVQRSLGTDRAGSQADKIEFLLSNFWQSCPLLGQDLSGQVRCKQRVI